MRYGLRLAVVLILLAVLVVGISPCGAAPSLDDFWAGSAKWTMIGNAVGENFAFHFPSIAVQGNEMWAYYITHEDFAGNQCYSVGRARSTDAVNWTNDGIVLHPGGYPYLIFPAAGSLYHVIGRTDGDGWSVNTVQDRANWMCYGPYTSSVPAGPMEADFVLMVDNNTADNANIVYIDVYDSTAGTVLASRTLTRREFVGTYQYNYIHLNFNAPGANHALEFRTYWYGYSYVKQQAVAVAEGSYPHFDDYSSGFPGIYKNSDGMWYLVYEGARVNPYNGQIGLAMSSDGWTFHRNATNPILCHNTTGWETINIGTPSLDKKLTGEWLLYYHGYGPSGDGGPYDCQIGFSYGWNLLATTKCVVNPTIPTVPGTWKAGTTGRRSTIIHSPGGLYYMAYEGSTDADPVYGFRTSRWTTGIARSQDKISWDHYAGNPILPQTSSDLGNDGPELAVFQGNTYLLVHSPDLYPGTLRYATDVYRLDWK